MPSVVGGHGDSGGSWEGVCVGVWGRTVRQGSAMTRWDKRGGLQIPRQALLGPHDTDFSLDNIY